METVYTAIPTRGQVWVTVVVSALQNTIAVPNSEFTWSGEAPATCTRNALVTRFLRTKHRWLWFVDDDTQPPEGALKQLLATAKANDAALVSGVTPFFQRRLVVNVQRDRAGWLEPWPYGEFEITKAGTACMIIRRDVFETLQFPWFNYFQDESCEWVQSEDLPFCDRAREAGFRLWCNAEVRCNHIKTVNLIDLCPTIEGAANGNK